MQSALAIVLLTPVLALLMLAEAALAKRAGRTVHSRGQTLNNLFIAVGQRALSATIGIAPLAGYVWLQNRVGQFDWDTSNVWHWVFAFFAVDLAMYLRHYLGHRVALLWAVHAVHHQSTEYNLTAATRLGWIQETILFSVPLAFLGVPPSMVVVFFGLGNLYQFLQHTELVGTLGIIDRIFMTPSNHRVHHGRNPEYLDANFGNILVIWDHLFGTYVPETVTPVYGTLNGLPSYDPLENNLAPLRALVSKVRQQPTWSARVSTLVRAPDWQATPADFTAPRPVCRHKRTQIPAWGLLGLTLVASLIVTARASTDAHVGGLTLIIVTTLVATGLLLDGRWVSPVAPTPRARVGAAIQTLAGASTNGPLAVLGRWLNRHTGVR